MPGAAIAMGPWAQRSNSIGPIDPFRMMTEMLDLRNTQAEWNAKTNLSNIMATSNGDTNLMMRRAMADPMSAWMLPQIKTLQDTQLTAAQIKTQTYNQNQIAAATARTVNATGFDIIQNALKLGAGNWQNFRNLATSGLQALRNTNPVEAAEVTPYINSIIHAYTDNLSKTDPDADFRSRVFPGLIGGAGLSAEGAAAVTTGRVPSTPVTVGGQPMAVTTGVAPGTIGTGTVSPMQLGEPMPGGGPIPPAAVAIPLGPGGGGGPPPTTGPAVSPGPVVTPSPAVSPEPVTPPAGDPDEPDPIVAPPINPFQTSPPVPEDQAGDGRPLYIRGQIPDTGWSLPVGPTGYVLNQQQQRAENNATDHFTGDKVEEAFRNAQSNLGSLQIMDADLNTLQGSGGRFLSPGMGEQFRTRFANRLNTISNIFGLGNIVDARDVGNAESLNKEINRLAINAASTTFGGQREAAITVERIAQSVPGIDNTYFGSKLLIAGIRANMQREIDAYRYGNEWIRDPVHHGSYYGADIAFNEKHPINDYINRALAPFGMSQGPDGELRFNSPQDVVRWADRGVISKQTAVDVLHKQFPNLKWR